MATQTIERTICDLDGIEGAETVTFAVGKDTYEIDLSAERIAEFDEVMAPYIENGWKIRNGVRVRPRHRPGTVTQPDEFAMTAELRQEIRSWARRKGFDIGDRGKIRQEIIDAWKGSR